MTPDRAHPWFAKTFKAPRPKRKATAAEIEYARGRAEALHEAALLAATWERNGANAAAVRTVLTGRAMKAWNEYDLLVPLEAAEAPSTGTPPTSAASSGPAPRLTPRSERVRPGAEHPGRVDPLGYSQKAPPA